MIFESLVGKETMFSFKGEKYRITNGKIDVGNHTGLINFLKENPNFRAVEKQKDGDKKTK